MSTSGFAKIERAANFVAKFSPEEQLYEKWLVKDLSNRQIAAIKELHLYHIDYYGPYVNLIEYCCDNRTMRMTMGAAVALKLVTYSRYGPIMTEFGQSFFDRYF